jgi:hypothetical protein
LNEIFQKIELEVGIPLLIARHMRIPKVIEVYVLDTLLERRRIPVIYQSGSCLQRLSLL